MCRGTSCAVVAVLGVLKSCAFQTVCNFMIREKRLLPLV